MIKPPLIALVAMVAAASAACADLPDVTGGICGNGVIEPEHGEECDGVAPAGTFCAGAGEVNACHYTCSGGATCPTGFACAPDARCRAASGLFVPAAGGRSPFDASDFGAADVDGDGFVDLVGVSDTQLSTRYGDAAATLAESSTFAIDAPVAAPIFARLDAEAPPNVIFPSITGIVSLAGAGHSYESFAYSSIAIQKTEQPVSIFGVQTAPQPDSQSPTSSLLFVIGAEAVFVGSIDDPAICLDGSAPTSGTDPCAAAPHTSDLVGRGPLIGKTGFRATGAAVPVTADTSDELVFAKVGDSTVSLWTTTFVQPPADGSGALPAPVEGIEQVDTLTLPGAGQVVIIDGVTAFGHFDHDACVDLLVPVKATVNGTLIEGYMIAYGATVGAPGTACTGRFDPFTDSFFLPVASGADTSGNITRAVVDLDGDGLSDVVTSDFIEMTTCTRDGAGCGGKVGIAKSELRNPRSWTHVIATNFNGDRRADLAGIVAGQPSIDAMLGLGDGHFNRIPIPTELPARELRTGDFDGDLIPDILAVLGDPTNMPEDDTLVVAFGSPSGGPSAPVDMGHFGAINSVSPVLLGALEYNVSTDLVVVSDRVGKNGNHKTHIAGLSGSPSRHMVSPFVIDELLEKTINGKHVQLSIASSAIAVQAGRFDGDGLVDLAAVGIGDRTQTTDDKLFVIAGSGDGDLSLSPARALLDLSKFLYLDGLYASGPLSADGPFDIVVGIDHADGRQLIIGDNYADGTAGITLARAEPTGLMAPMPTVSVQTLTYVPPAQAGQAIHGHGIHLGDLDGDGTADLVVELATAPDGISASPSPATSAALVAWSTSLDAPLDPVFELGAAGPTCRSVTPIQLARRGASELAMICGEGTASRLRVLDRDTAAGTWTVIYDHPIADGDGHLVVGDFNGDGLVDVAVTSVVGSLRSVQVYVQCEVTDAACVAEAQCASGDDSCVTPTPCVPDGESCVEVRP